MYIIVNKREDLLSRKGMLVGPTQALFTSYPLELKNQRAGWYSRSHDKSDLLNSSTN